MFPRFKHSDPAEARAIWLVRPETPEQQQAVAVAHDRCAAVAVDRGDLAAAAADGAVA